MVSSSSPPIIIDSPPSLAYRPIFDQIRPPTTTFVYTVRTRTKTSNNNSNSQQLTAAARRVASGVVDRVRCIMAPAQPEPEPASHHPLHSCCFCGTLRDGAVTAAVYDGVRAIILLLGFLSTFVMADESVGDVARKGDALNHLTSDVLGQRVVGTVFIIQACINIALMALLLVGIAKRSPACVLTWFAVSLMLASLDLSFSIYQLVIKEWWALLDLALVTFWFYLIFVTYLYGMELYRQQALEQHTTGGRRFY